MDPSAVENIDFVVIFNKQKLNVNFSPDSKIIDLKEHLQKLTGVPSTMQKIVYKGEPMFLLIT